MAKYTSLYFHIYELNLCKFC